MRPLSYALSVLLLPAVLLGGRAPAADAAEITPDQAQALTTQLRDWLHGLAGPSVDLPDLRATAAGDHYTLSVPIIALGGADNAVTANLRPLDGGRWAADDIRLPAAGSFTTQLPGAKGPPAAKNMRVTFAIAGQDTHGELDPGMIAPSSLNATLRGVAIDSQADGKRQTQRFDVGRFSLLLRPMPDNKLDIDEDGSAEGWRTAQVAPDGQALAVGAKRLSGSAHVEGLDRGQASALDAALGALAQAPTPERNERLRALVISLRGLLSAVRFDETIEGMQVAVPGQGNAEIDRLHLGWDSAAPDGNLTTALKLDLDGLSVPEMPPTLASLAPRHVELGISLAGLSTDALNKLALAALAPGANAGSLGPQIDALFADPGKTGGPRVGIDTLGFDIGPAKVDGHGSVIALSPTDVRGTARVSVTGFDALADKIRTDPQLEQALPFLILARGMARAEGPALIWDIVFTPGGLTVNGVDLRTMGQQPKGARKPPHPRQQP